MDQADIIIESRTQSAETIKQLLDQQGMDSVTSATQSDAPSAPPEGEKATSSPVPVETPGETAAATTDENTSAASETAQPKQDTQEPPKTGGFKRKLARAQADADRYRTEVEELKRQLASRAEKPEAPAAAAEPAAATAEPQWDDFADSENQLAAYTKAITKWNIAESARQRSEQEQQERTHRERASQQAAIEDDAKAQQERWDANVTAARTLHEDFDEVINSPGAVGSPLMIQAIRDNELGPELAYWLGKHPEESQRIADLTTVPGNAPPSVLRQKIATAIIEISRIAAKIDAEDEGQPAQTAASREARASAPATPAKATAQSAAPAAQPIPTPKPAKIPPPPPSLVGSRHVPNRTVAELSADELRSLSPDEFRKMRGV